METNSNYNEDVKESEKEVTGDDFQENSQEETKESDSINKGTFTQSEVDNIVEKRLSRARKKMEQEFSKKLADEIAEAEKLAKMNTDQKTQYEMEKRLKDLEAREKAIAKKELENVAKQMLIEKGLPSSLASVLNYADAETCNNSINAFEEAFNKAVASKIDDILKGSKPIKKAPSSKEYSMEELDNMSDAEYFAYKSSLNK